MKSFLTCIAAAVLVACPTFASAQGPALSGIVLTTDRTVDSTSEQSIARGIWHDGMNEQQKSYAMWRYFISRNMHKEIIDQDDYGNAAELMTKTGYALCFDWGKMWANIMADNGQTAARVGLNGHVIGATQYWGGWHAFDVDMNDLYVKADGVVASPSEIRGLKDANGKYVLRDGAPVKSFPWYLGPDSVKGTAGMYDKTSVDAPLKAKPTRKWVYNLALRPGQEIVLSWYGDPDVGFVCLSHLPKELTKKPFKSLREYLESNFDYYTQKEGKAKWNWGYRRGGLKPNPLAAWNGIDGNGRLTMDVGADGFKNALAMATASDNLQVVSGKLALKDAAKPGTLLLDFAIPYDYGDAWIDKTLPEKGITIELSQDGKEFQKVYPGGAGVDDGSRIRLFDLVRGRSAFVLKLTLDAGAAPLDSFKAIGALNLNYMVLPSVLQGANQVAVRLSDPKMLADNPLHVTYVYDQVGDDHNIRRIEKVLTFTPQALSQSLDTGRHWPLMREIRMVCGPSAPAAAAPVAESGELDWAAAPWPWVYSGVNFWNDFERGDRQGWAGQLTTHNTFNGSDFALDSSLMGADGQRQLKIIRFGSFLNRDTKFRCQVWVKNVAKLRFTTRDQEEDKNNYYEKVVTNLKDGAWQPEEIALGDLVNIKDPMRKIQNNHFLSNIYMEVTPAEGKTAADVEFMIDNAVCWDGQLKDDPCVDPDAPAKALANDPIWNARKPEVASK